MPGYPDDRSRERRHRDRRPYYDDDDSDEEYYRLRAPKSRDQRYDEPPTHARSSRRFDKYDASSDGEDYYPPRRRSHGDYTRDKARESPEIPPPPIGGDRKASKGRRGAHPDERPPGAIPVPGTEAAMSGSHEETDGRRRKGKSSRSPQKDSGEGPWDDAEIMPDPQKSSRDRDDHGSRRKPSKDIDDYDRRKPSKEIDDYDEPEPPRRHKGRDLDRDREYDRYDDPEPPRRSKRDPYDEPPRRKPSRPDADEDRRRRRAAYADDDSEQEYEKPRRREKPSKYDDGYGTDRPRRQPRDDYYDRGYRTDGRDSKRDRYRDEDRRRSGRHSHDHDDYDRRRHDKRSSGRKDRDGVDFNGMLEKGQKNWKKVEPVAKPLLAQLAKTYLQDGRTA